MTDRDGANYVNMLRSAEARGKKKIEEARKKAFYMIKKQAIIEANLECEQFRKVIEFEFNEKWQAKAKADELHLEIIREKEKEKLKDMNTRVAICAPYVLNLLEILVTTITPAIPYNYEARVAVEDKETPYIPSQPHLCDEFTWMLLERCAHMCDMAISHRDNVDSNHNIISDSSNHEIKPSTPKSSTTSSNV